MRGALMSEEEAKPGTETSTEKIILVVEDDEDNRLVYHEMLSTLAQYHIHQARNSTEALDFIAHNKPDLCILDYRLPQMNGLQLYDYLHALPGFEHLPAILISAAPTNQLKQEIESRNLVHIEKPFDLDEFLGTVDKVLGES
jgi:CheY-like chemotaxis protein